jgi:regulator of protease activity HflC (stomatin/prohibitin superfamily)
MEEFVFTGVLVLAALLGARLLLARKVVVREGEVGLLYRQGRFVRRLAPGAHWLWRYGARVEPVDTRLRTLTVPGQEVLSQDAVGLKVSVTVRFAVEAPELALHRVQRYEEALYAAVQLALRAEASRQPLEELLAGRGELGARLRERVATEARGLGLAVEAVEPRDVMLPAELRRTFAEALKARKEGQAALERARGETAALRHLANAARLVESTPALLQLRVLQTLGGASGTPGHTFVLGVGPEFAPLGRQRPGTGSPPEPAREEPAPE